MAILSKFEAQVFVDSIRAEEFEDDEHEPKPSEISRYIEAVSGATFEVKVLFEPSYQFTKEDALTANVHIDGEYAAGRVLERSTFPTRCALGVKPYLRLDGRDSKDGASVTLYKFQFSDLETRDLEKTDDTSKFRDKYGDLGTIRAQVWRVSTYGDIEMQARPTKEMSAIPEKALKGRPLDVATRYLATPSSTPFLTIGTRYLDKDPLATFYFKYRTRRALQSLMILERSSTPVPLEDRPFEELTREEAVELLRRQKEQLKIKQERGLKRGRSSTVAAHTRPMRPLKSTKGNNGETIFHLESDDDDDNKENEDDDEIEEVPQPKRETIIVDLVDM